jgi:hypothetical protein
MRIVAAHCHTGALSQLVEHAEHATLFAISPDRERGRSATAADMVFDCDACSVKWPAAARQNRRGEFCSHDHRRAMKVGDGRFFPAAAVP